jgi:hypothetical protein
MAKASISIVAELATAAPSRRDGDALAAHTGGAAEKLGSRIRPPGRSHKDAMRCLERHLARVVYRQLVAEQAVLSLT